MVCMRISVAMTYDQNAPFTLVVDDDLMIRMDACDILADAGFRQLEAGDVAEAIAVLEGHADEVVLLFTDVQMPGDRNGFDLARETSRRWPDIKILVSSGAARPREDDMPAGAIFVGKPFSADVVYQRLQELPPDGRKPEPLKQKALS